MAGVRRQPGLRRGRRQLRREATAGASMASTPRSARLATAATERGHITLAGCGGLPGGSGSSSGTTCPPAGRGIGAIADRDEADAFVESWRATLAANGLLGVSWPKEYGGAGLSKLEQVVLVEELARAGVPDDGLQRHVQHQDARRHAAAVGHRGAEASVPPPDPVRRGPWCQGFSEPGSGLRPGVALDQGRARRRPLGDRRSEAVDFAGPGGELDLPPGPHRPGGAQAPRAHVPAGGPGPARASRSGRSGPCRARASSTRCSSQRRRRPPTTSSARSNGGWAVATTLLGLERGEEAATNPILFRAELDRLLAMAADGAGRPIPWSATASPTPTPAARSCASSGLRILTGVLSRGTLGPEASISKLYWSEYHQRATRLALDVLGADALVVEGRSAPRLPHRRPGRAQHLRFVGRQPSTTPWPARSTPARRRCSATSSERPCSASRASLADRQPAAQPAGQPAGQPQGGRRTRDDGPRAHPRRSTTVRPATAVRALPASVRWSLQRFSASSALPSRISETSRPRALSASRTRRLSCSAECEARV